MVSFKYNNVYLGDVYSIAGINENNGILNGVNRYLVDYYDGEKTIEDCEIKIQKEVLSNILTSNSELVVSGDLTNQLTASSLSISNIDISYLGIYNACATFGEGLILLSNFIQGKFIKEGVCITSSHNLCSEKQFRFPIEYGGLKPDYSTFTCTGSVGVIVSKKASNIRVVSSTIGSVVDMGIKDANNMGAVMAPSAVKTLTEHLKNTNTTVKDYDIILSGDLGKYGEELFKKILKIDNNIIIKNYYDCGAMIYKHSQEKYSGGSGPVCLPLVLFNNILKNKKYKKILLLVTGSLHSPLIVNQKKSIPSITHAVSLEVI